MNSDESLESIYMKIFQHLASTSSEYIKLFDPNSGFPSFRNMSYSLDAKDGQFVEINFHMNRPILRYSNTSVREDVPPWEFDWEFDWDDAYGLYGMTERIEAPSWMKTPQDCIMDENHPSWEKIVTFIETSAAIASL